MDLQETKSPSSEKKSSSFRLRNPSLNTLRLRRIFDLFDSDGDEEITLGELSLALSRLGIDGSDDLSSLVGPHIRPGNAGLRFEDFVSLHRSLGDSLFGAVDEEPEAEEEEEDMREAFRVFDEDGDGFISAKELQAVLGKLGLEEGQSIERVNEMIFSVDCNNDGRVDFGEFKNMMRTVASTS
ncbi:uncharacterized protein M6B38_305200 [Iris pallida]|uniref:EF-hand domain-containing protein n=1 Tax=Iris pallida TaxID=29817 RepID=A0AAX6GTS8_IRIPA|nr:hypothetical protein M6B38_347720 [Iris pallida]KAJ6841762.1 uncharacterized protein M6B38_305200 [Iris pallida]